MWDVLYVWDLETGVELHRLAGHEYLITSIAQLPDGHHAIIGDSEGVLRLWDLDTGAEIRRFDGHGGSIQSVVATPDGRSFLSCSGDSLSMSKDYTVRLWNIQASNARARDASGTPVRQDAAERCPQLLCCVMEARPFLAQMTAQFASGTSGPGAELRCFNHGTDWIRSAAAFPDGRRALSSANDMLHVWHLRSGFKRRSFKEPRINAVAILSDGRLALCGSAVGRLKLLDLKTGVHVWDVGGHRAAILSVALLPDGRRAVSGSVDNTVRLWDLATGSELRCFGAPLVSESDRVFTVAVMTDGRHVLSGVAGGTMHLWDLETGTELRCFRGHVDEINAIAPMPNGRRALSASTDRTLRLWDVETGAELARYVGEASFTALALIPGRNQVLTGNTLGQVVPFRLPP